MEIFQSEECSVLLVFVSLTCRLVPLKFERDLHPEPCDNGVIMVQGPTELSYVSDASGNAVTDFPFLH